MGLDLTISLAIFIVVVATLLGCSRRYKAPSVIMNPAPTAEPSSEGAQNGPYSLSKDAVTVQGLQALISSIDAREAFLKATIEASEAEIARNAEVRNRATIALRGIEDLSEIYE